MRAPRPRLTITTEQLNNVVEVPTSAISYSNGQATVTEVVAGSQKSVPVTTGAAASGETQITGGLKAGDVVIERVVKFNGTDRRRQPQPLRWQRNRNPHRWSGTGGFPAAGAASPAVAASPAAEAASQGAAADMDPVIELEDVTKVYRTGTIAVAALRGVSLHDRPRRVRVDHGSVGIGQVDFDAHPGLPGRTDERTVLAER